MTPTQLRAKLEAKLGRRLNVSIVASGAHRGSSLPARSRPGRSGVEGMAASEAAARGVVLRPGAAWRGDARWSNEVLDYPSGEDFSAAEAENLRRIAEKRAARLRHPSAGEFAGPSLRLVEDEDGLRPMAGTRKRG
jgi:hypothetical protein